MYNFQVTGPEVLAPLRDTMGFIHCNHGDLCFRSKKPEAFCFQTFRCDVDNFNRFSSSRRHDSQCAPSLQNGVNDSLLPRAETLYNSSDSKDGAISSITYFNTSLSATGVHDLATTDVHSHMSIVADQITGLRFIVRH